MVIFWTVFGHSTDKMSNRLIVKITAGFIKNENKCKLQASENVVSWFLADFHLYSINE